MTRHVPISAFKDRASEYVSAAESGEEIIITRHGKPAVVLRAASAESEQRRRAEEAMTRIMERRERLRSAGMTATIDELIAWKNEGRP